jgi:fructosamine-3-kinase
VLEYIEESHTSTEENVYKFGVELATLHNVSTDKWGKTPFGRLFFGSLKNPLIIHIIWV